MIISSRPEDDVMGDGEFTMKVSFEELQLIAAFLYNTRLGPDPYKQAAFNLINEIEDFMGDDFMSDASDSVAMSFSVEDDRGNVIDNHPCSEICIEV